MYCDLQINISDQKLSVVKGRLRLPARHAPILLLNWRILSRGCGGKANAELIGKSWCTEMGQTVTCRKGCKHCLSWLTAATTFMNPSCGRDLFAWGASKAGSGFVTAGPDRSAQRC